MILATISERGRRLIDIFLLREAIPSVPLQASVRNALNISEIDRFRATWLAAGGRVGEGEEGRRGNARGAVARRTMESKWLLNIQCARRIA